MYNKPEMQIYHDEILENALLMVNSVIGKYKSTGGINSSTLVDSTKAALAVVIENCVKKGEERPFIQELYHQLNKHISKNA